jgi:hypothetical protein
MLIFAPSTKEQCNHISIAHTIRDRIDAAYCGDIAFLFHSAMQVRRLKQNSRPTYTGQNHSAQQAADNDEYRTAVSRACALHRSGGARQKLPPKVVFLYYYCM